VVLQFLLSPTNRNNQRNPGVRFKRANYLSPEILFDKSNEWSDYFEKEFLR